MATGQGQPPVGSAPAFGCTGARPPHGRFGPRRPWLSSRLPVATAVHQDHQRNQPHKAIRDLLGEPGRCSPVHRDCHRTVALVSPGAQCHSSSRSGGRHRTSSSRNRRRCCPDRGRRSRRGITGRTPGGQRRGARNAPSRASRDGLSISARLSYHMILWLGSICRYGVNAGARPDRTARFAIAMLCTEHFYARMPPNA